MCINIYTYIYIHIYILFFLCNFIYCFYFYIYIYTYLDILTYSYLNIYIYIDIAIEIFCHPSLCNQSGLIFEFSAFRDVIRNAELRPQWHRITQAVKKNSSFMSWHLGTRKMTWWMFPLWHTFGAIMPLAYTSWNPFDFRGSPFARSVFL